MIAEYRCQESTELSGPDSETKLRHQVNYIDSRHAWVPNCATDPKSIQIPHENVGRRSLLYTIT